MRTELRHAGAQVCFLLLDLDDGERAAARDLAFAAQGDVFVRRFPADESIDAIYARFAAAAPALLAQAARRERAPWEQALERLVPLAGGVDWWLAGSAAVAARGIDVAVRDLDVVTSVDGAFALGRLLRDHLIEPVTLSDDWIARAFGRAFLGIRVEWVGGVVDAVDTPEPVDFGPTAAAQLETITFRSRRVRVPPLELQLAVTRRRGLDERAAAIEAALRIRKQRESSARSA